MAEKSKSQERHQPLKAKPKTVGPRIRSTRTELGLSQRDISLPGTSYAYISRIESGARNPSLEALIQIGDQLSATGLYLLTGDAEGHCPLCERG